jgi:uncharacterized protein YggU (UPF0235/DUF167 family)
VEEVLAAALGVPAGCVRIVAGRSDPRKVVEISGASQAEIGRRLSAVARRSAEDAR